jgi:hypothetical protein
MLAHGVPQSVEFVPQMLRKLVATLVVDSRSALVG